MKNILTMAAVAAALALGGAAANADSLAHEFFPGHGDPQDFVVTTVGDIQLGLEAQSRGVGPTFTRVGDTYYVPAGQAWNFDFDIDTNATGTGSTLLSQYDALITVSGAASGTYNPLYPVNDNSGNTQLAQNSENLSFNGLFSSPVGTGAPLNPNLPGLYTITLDLTPVTGGQTIEDVINVSVPSTPLPSAAGMGFGMLGLIGAAALLRKKLAVA